MSRDKGAQGFKGFISFEGIEGCGKTTQVKLLGNYLRSKNQRVLITEEPGGTKIGRKIRTLLLSPENHMDPLTELLLYNSSRAQHVREVIYPALIQNTVVITDRFVDSTVSYQGYARGIDVAIIRALNEIVVPDLKPFVTFLLDLEVEDGLKRNRGAQKIDRLELETIEFHNQVRNGYLQIASEEPDRIKVIDASGSIEEVSKKIIEVLETVWP
jgi:dTMP kinase